MGTAEFEEEFSFTENFTRVNKKDIVCSRKAASWPHSGAVSVLRKDFLRLSCNEAVQI